MAEQKPRNGWIYMINPHKVFLSCKIGHKYEYDLKEPGEIKCKNSSCSHYINSSRVLRGTHPYIVWISEKFQNDCNYIETITAIPLTSKDTYTGLPTTYPVNPTKKNSLSQQSFALVHQLCTIDANCFKNFQGSWSSRIGQLTKEDKKAIKKRLKYYLFGDEDESPSQDWFRKNATPELLMEIYNYLPDRTTKQNIIEKLIDTIETI